MHNVSQIFHKRLHKIALFPADFFIRKEFILYA